MILPGPLARAPDYGRALTVLDVATAQTVHSCGSALAEKMATGGCRPGGFCRPEEHLLEVIARA